MKIGMYMDLSILYLHTKFKFLYLFCEKGTVEEMYIWIYVHGGNLNLNVLVFIHCTASYLINPAYRIKMMNIAFRGKLLPSQAYPDR